ncbi:hypothetical protein [Cryptosporidium parvum Iowa II]|uniref:Uncharacterized protein n=2 Tax=Cryptosporidium parvum TaxID=5807 RepID=Q5CRT8_CRYPI|nr:hypothetical protein [Cryptosporidium parvum Iowa II]EAK88098.1 hypothetical protein cgd5_1510 [Cryptosporidium parvum Iowa II]QOY41584.1 Uncharacterized protein CPATCC_0023300 [Cryptosporidium parvum]WKS77804.1 hypothetical protein CPCDC_5g1510 [Cryptosporidium sp. 43IA8]WRK32295.1 Uncharacterized protein cpbgf_5001510 [Cryptosporidium parvum]|eukprot:QOY41584.1 hypothetical protein CPATCC_002153 [Cryptosporidium parvum]
MPFKCCMGNNLQDGSNDERNEDCDLINKVPKPIDLNEGYNSQIELLVFNNRMNKNQTYQGFNSKNNSIYRTKYDPGQYFNITPITFVETKVSNLLNTPTGSAIAEASSNIMFSNCNSPIKLVTSIVATPKPNSLNYTEPPILTTDGNLNQNNSDKSFVEKRIPQDSNFEEKKISVIEEINNYSEFFKDSDEKIKYIELEDQKSTHTTKSDQSQKELESYSIENENEFEYGNSILEKYIDNTPNTCHELDFDTINKTNNEKTSNFDISGIKNDIDKFVFLSNKLKNENSQIEKKKKKSKKTIHIEISFSPKNNIFVDAQHNQNESKLESHKKTKIESNDSNRKNHIQNEEFFGKNINKYISVESNNTDPTRFDERPIEVIHKTDGYDPNIKDKSDEVYTSEYANMTKEPTRIKDYGPVKEEISNISNNHNLQSFTLNEIKNNKNMAGTEYNNSFEENSNIGIKSFEKLIPFIDDPEASNDYLTNFEKSEKFKFSPQKKLINSLTDIKQPNNKLTEFSQRTLEKLNGSLPIVESDPQLAQLFASAQIRIEDINNQKESIENNKHADECDPIDLIVKFLDNPSKYKDSICWATIKAVKEVYEPQVEYAKKELDRWMNSENNSDESKENMEYYNNLISELQGKIMLAEKARELLLTRYKSDEIQFMLQNEKNSLEEIKKKMNKESEELKSIEEQYLNGCINLKEDVRVSRIKIRNFENEIKSKLAEIHKLEELLRIHEIAKF